MAWKRLLLATATLLCGATPASAQDGGEYLAKITAYCLSGTTRSGTPVREGVVAVDRNWIPLGAQLTIEGLEGLVFSAEDTGSGVRGPHVDRWMRSCTDAVNWGVQYRHVEWWR